MEEEAERTKGVCIWTPNVWLALWSFSRAASTGRASSHASEQTWRPSAQPATHEKASWHEASSTAAWICLWNGRPHPQRPRCMRNIEWKRASHNRTPFQRRNSNLYKCKFFLAHFFPMKLKLAFSPRFGKLFSWKKFLRNLDTNFHTKWDTLWTWVFFTKRWWCLSA